VRTGIAVIALATARFIRTTAPIVLIASYGIRLAFE
jgi:hypothetical protein